MNTTLLLYIAVICGLTSCQSNSQYSRNDTTIVDVRIKQGQPLPAKEWHCYNVDNEELICIPQKWHFINQDKYLLMADLNTVDSNLYFVVLKHDKAATGLTSTTYLKKIYQELKNDNREKYCGFRVTKIKYEDKALFDGEFYTSVGNVNYVTLSEVFEKDNNLFELALKTYRSRKKPEQETIKNILYNFYYKKNVVFSVHDKIIGFEDVDITKL